MDTNTQKMQSGERNDCEENKLPKSFTFHILSPTINGLFIRIGMMKRNYFNYLLSLSENQSYFRLKRNSTKVSKWKQRPISELALKPKQPITSYRLSWHNAKPAVGSWLKPIQRMPVLGHPAGRQLLLFGD
jgi:hypothetical protein